MTAAASPGLPRLDTDALWREVTTRAGDRCECTGQCGRKHRTRTGPDRCKQENKPWAPLHAVPRDPDASPAAAVPASACDALCDSCHAALALIRARACQAASGALSAVETLF